MSGLIWIQTVCHPNGNEKSSIQRVKYDTITKCEGLVKAILVHQRSAFSNKSETVTSSKFDKAVTFLKKTRKV